jgi:hypothetical protein
LVVLAMPSRPASVEASSRPYKDHVRPIITAVSGYVADATAMTPSQAATRALFIPLRLEGGELFFSGPPSSAKLHRLLVATVADVETAVRTWYRYRDPDVSIYWLFLAWRDLHQARQVFRRMQCGWAWEVWWSLRHE